MVLGFTATFTHLIDFDGRLLRREFFNQIYTDLPWMIAKKLNLFPVVRYIEILNPVGFQIQIDKSFKSYYRKLEFYRKENILTRFLREISLQVELSVYELA